MNLPCETRCDSQRPRSSSISSPRCRKILHKSPRHFPAIGSCGSEGGGNLLGAAQAAGVRRYIQQLSGFFLKARAGLAGESDDLVTEASPAVTLSAQMYAELEARLQDAGELECVGLRYGFFYGPRTWYHPDGAAADQVRGGEMPIIGEGQAVWSWIHIEDAAVATVLALTAPAGIYNIVDDDPSPVSRWLPSSRVGWERHRRPGSPKNKRARQLATTPFTTERSSTAHRTKRPRGLFLSARAGWNGSASRLLQVEILHTSRSPPVTPKISISRNSLNAKWIHYEGDESHAF
jgi:NAD dependent epimerase/dehydratase family